MTYNRKVFPGLDEAAQLGGAQIEKLVTHTIFAIDLEYCLLIMNLQYVRNPNVREYMSIRKKLVHSTESISASRAKQVVSALDKYSARLRVRQ